MQDKKNGLYEFASHFEITTDNKLHYKLSEVKLEFHDGIKFILAEFIRKKHAERSKNIIDTNKISSQINGVIPQRLWKVLGNICASHTKNFDDVMKLPYCEVGIDIEDTHPRFISCLLQIGDLLDLDNNRFSEVMLRTISKIPVETLNHKSKHLSIESFRADTTQIEVLAKCNDYDTANITQHWLNYLNSEISQQMINWNNIVPSKDFGYLPTIGSLKVELLNYEQVDGKKKPQFTVDTDKAMELLQGAGLYDGAYQSIREILQNAVDATLLKIWLDNEEVLKNSTPQMEQFKSIVKSYPIKLTITEKEVVGEDKLWEFCVEDKGTGISSEDLSYLITHVTQI